MPSAILDSRKYPSTGGKVKSLRVTPVSESCEFTSISGLLNTYDFCLLTNYIMTDYLRFQWLKPTLEEIPAKSCGFLVSMVTECHAPLFTRDPFFVNYNKGAQWSFWHPWSVLADGYLSHLAQLRVAGIQHTIEQLCKLALYICIDWLAS